MNSNEQIDADILQCREDILRASDIIPPYDKKTYRQPKSQNNTENTTASTDTKKAASEKEKTAPEDVKPIPLETTKLKKISPMMAAVVEANKKAAMKTPKVEQTKSSRDDTPQTQARLIKLSDDKSAKKKETKQARAEIPRFDLAEDIMAEHRKIVAIKRKGPDKKIEIQEAEPQDEPISYAVGPQRLALSEQEQIITEIVARDIERLCRGGTLGWQR